MKILKDILKKEVYKLGIIYIVAMTIVGAISNYFTWHSEFSPLVGILVFIFVIMLWIAFYVPIYIFMKRDAWRISDFGFVVNKRTIIISAVLVSLIMELKSSPSVIFGGYAIIEAFARVGEEAFYRGFIYTFSMKLFKEKQNPWLWAVLISSLMFAVVHTQTFLPHNSLNMISIFLNALILGLLRFLTDSILPAIIIHCASNGGILCMLVGILMYIVIVVIAHFAKNKKVESKDISVNNEN